MQTHQPGILDGDRWLRRATLAVLLTLIGLCVGAPAEAVNLQLSDGEQDLAVLPIGTDLYVGATQWVPSSAVEVRLVDWQGQTVVQQERIADERGELPLEALWLRTGIRGCDCDVPGEAYEAYPFEHPSEAIQILGLKVTVQLVDPNLQEVITSRKLRIVESTEPLIYSAGPDDCPRRRLEIAEPLRLVSDGPTGGATVFLVAHRDEWQVGTPFADVRPGFERGQRVKAKARGWSDVLWQGVESRPGRYDILIRWREDGGGGGGGGNDGDILLLEAGDEILRQPEIPLNRHKIGGLVIDDWGCDGH